MFQQWIFTSRNRLYRPAKGVARWLGWDEPKLPARREPASRRPILAWAASCGRRSSTAGTTGSFWAPPTSSWCSKRLPADRCRRARFEDWFPATDSDAGWADPTLDHCTLSLNYYPNNSQNQEEEERKKKRWDYVIYGNDMLMEFTDDLICSSALSRVVYRRYIPVG